MKICTSCTDAIPRDIILDIEFQTEAQAERFSVLMEKGMCPECAFTIIAMEDTQKDKNDFDY